MSQPTEPSPNSPASPTPLPEDDPALHDIVFRAKGLVVTYRLARLIALWWLSVGVLTGCFWIILDPHTSGMIDTVASSLVVTIVTAWIATASNAHGR